MLSFMFGVLTSLFFWAAFFVVGFFVSSLLVKHFAPRTFRFITTGEISGVDHAGEYVATSIVFFSFWPVVLLVVAVKFVCKIAFKLVWRLFVSGVKGAIAIIPDIEIKSKKE